MTETPPTPDLSNHDGFITKTSGFDNETNIAPIRGDFEIGVKDGTGYIKLPVGHDGEISEFPTTVEAVEQYMIDREQRHPTPTLPDDIDKNPTVETPPTWERGTAVHTGGGIYNRIWAKELEQGYLEVGYKLPTTDGVSAGLYNDDGEWLGDVTHTSINEATPDKEAQEKALELMKEIDTGDYDNKINSLTSNMA